MKALVDTSVIIDFLRQKDKTTTWLYSLSQQHQLFASIITHTELHAGRNIWKDPTAYSELSDIFSALKLIPLTKIVSHLAGQIRSTHDVSLIDAIIAATALSQKLPLATINQKHFNKIPHLKILKQ